MIYLVSAILIVLLLILWRLLHMSASTDRVTASLQKLDGDVQTLINNGNPGAVAAAVDAFANTTADAIDAIDAKIPAPTPAP